MFLILKKKLYLINLFIPNINNIVFKIYNIDDKTIEEL